jgi:hypothetical protein
MVTEQLLKEIEAGDAEPLSRAARRIPSARNGRPATISRLFRWIFHGVKGPGDKRVYLEAAKLPAGWVTTPSAIGRFVKALTPHPESAPPVYRTPSRRQRAADRAGEELERMGI